MECVMGQCATNNCNECCNNFVLNRLRELGRIGDDICPHGYIDEPDTDYWGNDIGTCGTWGTRDNAARECDARDDCLGFSIIDNSNDFGANFGPWCLKSDVSTSAFQENHHFCLKEAPDAQPTAYPTENGAVVWETQQNTYCQEAGTNYNMDWITSHSRSAGDAECQRQGTGFCTWNCVQNAWAATDTCTPVRSGCGSYVMSKVTGPDGSDEVCSGATKKKECDATFCEWDKTESTCTRLPETCGYGVKKVKVEGPFLFIGNDDVESSCDCQNRCLRAGGQYWGYSVRKAKCLCSNNGLIKVTGGNKVKWYSSHLAI